MTHEELIDELEKQRSLMIAVSTGGPRIDEVNEEYIERRRRISTELARRRLTDPNPHPDLWSWYHQWSSGDLPSYKSRRKFISDLFGPLMDELASVSGQERLGISGAPTGWPRVDRTVDEIQLRLDQAEVEEHFQQIGLLCREVQISLAQSVYKPERHPSEDGVSPSKTDARRMLDAYIATELKSKRNEAVRRHVKAALALANELQHDRTADQQQAFLCAEASVVPDK